MIEHDLDDGGARTVFVDLVLATVRVRVEPNPNGTSTISVEARRGEARVSLQTKPRPMETTHLHPGRAVYYAVVGSRGQEVAAGWWLTQPRGGVRGRRAAWWRR